MPDNWDLWDSYAQDYEYLDYGWGSDTEKSMQANTAYLDYGFGSTDYSVGPDQYDDDTMEYVAADRFSFMAADDEGEFYDPNEPNVYPPGTSVVNLEDFRSGSGDFDDVTNYGSDLKKLAGLLQGAGKVVGQTTGALDPILDPIFGGDRGSREQRRAAEAQSGSIPPGARFSDASVTLTTAERMKQLTAKNLRELFGAEINVTYLANVPPKPNSVTIPSGTISTRSGTRRAYARTKATA